MKKIWNYLRHHLKEDFHLLQYTSLAAFIAFGLFINYTFNLENGFLDKQVGVFKVFCFFLTYATAYYVALSTYTFFRNEDAFWSDRIFWRKSLLVLIILSIDCSMPYVREVIAYFFHEDLQRWVYKVGNNILSQMIIMIPLLLYYYKFDRTEKHIYGLKPDRFNVRPYFIMLAIMIPLIAIASIEGSFGRQYPMYKPSGAHIYLGIPEWVTAGIYELVYGLDFVTVEYLFRGFMVIGMAHVLGRKCILPMITAYCFIHFGKPMGEAISSIFGGFILGVVALETRSVWGGIIVHMGIAWLMEIAAYLSKH
ncbi:CPBP family intramembrane glutamic endopeptidase [Pseudochryseolinea flava]|uniref:CPBP family intramembrane metalloprotease n=1 Tax=Pseudochryseolinea flava TaxID=2059302 RepID=A0A364XUM3_9BACT|nr:CPBP family intramembrane glutamic endopeptidase [Pseudochryseolinea flava]RAV97839.1 CPBP family intramembrane metalloprotease [Pseudochryseolinea flava]